MTHSSTDTARLHLFSSTHQGPVVWGSHTALMSTAWQAPGGTHPPCTLSGRCQGWAPASHHHPWYFSHFNQDCLIQQNIINYFSWQQISDTEYLRLRWESLKNLQLLPQESVSDYSASFNYKMWAIKIKVLKQIRSEELKYI